jgi:predicted transcriptional regulator of viral defense system
VKGLYASAYRSLLTSPRKPSVPLRHEPGNLSLTYLQFGYLAGKEGPLAGQKLCMHVKRMEMAYYDLNRRGYELTRHVSLLHIDPVDLVRLRATARCTIRLPETLFDMDGPGHYFRRIESVANSIPCVTREDSPRHHLTGVMVEPLCSTQSPPRLSACPVFIHEEKREGKLPGVHFVAIICHLWHTICMEFSELLEVVGQEPVFETGLLLAGDVDPDNVRRQFSRWTAAGRIFQLRRGLYALAPPFQKVKPHPFLVANRLVHGSYVSLQSGLAYYALIPEAVPVTTSVTTLKPGSWDTPLGVYEFRHVKTELFFGYQRIDLGNEQQAFVATPEKALLDLVHLQRGGDALEYLQQLRLQNLDRLDLEQLLILADRAKSRKLRRAVEQIVKLAATEAEEYETL